MSKYKIEPKPSNMKSGRSTKNKMGYDQLFKKTRTVELFSSSYDFIIPVGTSIIRMTKMNHIKGVIHLHFF